jgi:hypothetical protein
MFDVRLAKGRTCARWCDNNGVSERVSKRHVVEHVYRLEELEIRVERLKPDLQVASLFRD